MNGFQRIFLSACGCVIAVCVISALSMLLCGCGRRSEKSNEPSGPVTIAYAAVPHAALVQIAFTKGFFKDEGLKVRPQAHAFGKPALAAMFQGKADLATAAETPVMYAIMDGRRICISATIETSNTDNAIVARKDLGILKPRDIRGKTVGIPLGTGAEFFLYSFLTAHGMDRTDVGIINMTPEEMREGLINKRIAAAVMWDPERTSSKKALGDKAIVFYEKKLYTDIFCLAADSLFAKNRPDTMKKIVKVLIRAEVFARQHPEEAVNIVADFLNMDKPALLSIWNDFHFKVALNQSLIITLEDETRWAIQNRRVKSNVMPDYLDFICADALSAVRPDRVRIIK